MADILVEIEGAMKQGSQLSYQNVTHSSEKHMNDDGMIEIVIIQDDFIEHEKQIKYEKQIDSIFPHSTSQNENEYKSDDSSYLETQNLTVSERNAAENFICGVCHEQFNDEEILDIHYRSHNETRVFSWPIYKKLTHKNVVTEDSSDEDLTKNLSTDENFFMCFLCEDTFIRKERFENHMQDHINKSDNNNENGQKDSTAEKIRIFTDNAFICLVCHKGFGSKRVLNKHVEIHTTVRKNICHICKESFNSRGNLVKHLKIHKNNRPYTCFACGKGFKLNHHLTNHMRIHTGEKPFKCEQCGKTFNEHGSLKRHYRSHSDLRPYECDICGISFKQSHHLSDHIRSHTGQKLYKCTICNKALSSSNSLQKHYRIHTGERPYKCDICDKAFADKSTLRRHTSCHESL